jgi:putative peptidoglycan lipid II flippase
LIFERGNFTAADTSATARALQYYALGSIGYSVVRIVSPAFYAMHQSRVPVAASVTSVAVNVLLNIILVRLMGYVGLALGTSLAATVNAAIQVLWLRHQLDGIEGRRLLVTLLKLVVASLAMAAAAWFANAWLQNLFPGSGTGPRAVRVTGAIALALAVLAAAGSLLRVREFEEARSLIITRLRRGRR